MKQVRYFCSTNYQLNEFLLCAQPRVQLMFLFKKMLLFTFVTRVWCWNQLAEIWGVYRIQSYFPSTIPGNAIASSHLLPLYSSTAHPEFESKIQLQTFLWIGEQCGIFQMVKSGSTFTYLPSQGKTVKKTTIQTAKGS